MMKPQHFCTNPHARDRLRAAVEADREVNAPQAFGMRVFRADVVAVLDALDALDAPAGAPAEPIEVAAGLAPADPPARCPNPHCAGGRVGGAWGPGCAVCQVGAP